MSFRSDLDALVLATLTAGAMHGYDISRRINQCGEGTVRVQEGQLYPILHRLEADGLIAADWVPQEGKPARKVYRLTDSGHAALEVKRADWARFAATVGALMNDSPQQGPENA